MRNPLERCSWMPILLIEMRARMRWRWLPLMLVVIFVAVLVELLRNLPLFWTGAAPDTYMHLPFTIELRTAEVGWHLFIELAVLQAFFILLLAPAFSAAAFIRELGQHDFDALALTPISSAGIVIGKQLSSMLIVALLLFCTLPITSIVFIFGGVSLLVFVLTLIMLCSMLFCCSAIGVWCSVQFRGYPASFAWAYGLCALWFIVLPIAYRVLYDSSPSEIGFVMILLLISVLTVMLFVRYGAHEDIVRATRHRLTIPIRITALLMLILLWLSGCQFVYWRVLPYSLFLPFNTNQFYRETDHLAGVIIPCVLILILGLFAIMFAVDQIKHLRRPDECSSESNHHSKSLPWR